jgi:hypothetical protein
MDKFKKAYLEQNYNKIGPLDLEDYVAIKMLSQQTFKISDVDLNKLIAIDENGTQAYVSPEQIKEGDTIRISATVQNALGGPTKKGTLTIEDIKDSYFEPHTGKLIIDSDKYCLVQNIEPRFQVLQTLLDKPEEYNLTRKDIETMLPPDVRWNEFKKVKDELERKKGWDLDINDLDLEFEEEIEELEEEEEIERTSGSSSGLLF